MKTKKTFEVSATIRYNVSTTVEAYNEEGAELAAAYVPAEEWDINAPDGGPEDIEVEGDSEL